MSFDWMHKWKTLVGLKCLYFTLNAAIYGSYSFTNLYLQDQWHFHSYETTLLNAITSLSFFVSILMVWIADALNKYQLILTLFTTLYIFSFNGLLLRNIFLESKSDIKWVWVITCLSISSLSINTIFPVHEIVQLCLIKDLYWKANNQENFSCTSESNAWRMLYGRQRLWGTVSQGLVTAFMGVSIEFFGYSCIFVIVTSFGLLFLIIQWLMLFKKDIINIKNQCEGSKMSNHPEEKLYKTLKNPYTIECTLPLVQKNSFYGYIIFFLCIVLISGFTRSILGILLAEYLHKSLKQSFSNVGFVLAVRVFPEIIVFALLDKIQRCMGWEGIFLTAQIIGLLRIIGYCFLGYIHMNLHRLLLLPCLLVLESMKGVNNALAVGSGVHIIDMMSAAFHSKHKGVLQALFNIAQGPASATLAGIVGGYILHSLIHLTDYKIFTYIFWFTCTLQCLSVILMATLYFSLHNLFSKRN